MTEPMMPVCPRPTIPATPAADTLDQARSMLDRRRLRWRGYFRMGRTIRFENFLGTVLVWALVERSQAFEGRTLVILGVVLAATMAMVATTGTLDDLQGLRDGSDLANYTKSDPSGRRPMTRKPLLLGWVTEREAVRYAWITAATAVALVVTAWLLAGGSPRWPLAGYLLEMTIGFQYSAGLRLSYHGLQEATLFFIVAGTVLWPVGLITGELPAEVIVQALLYAVWFVQVSMFSNSHDRDGDGAADRRTMAVLLDERANAVFMSAIFVGGWIIATVGFVAGWLPPLALAVAPVLLGLQAGQVRHGVVGHDHLRARTLGFWVLRIGMPALFAINVGTNWT